MTAGVLCIGTELTRGELVNTNAAWLAEALTRIGLEVTSVDCVDDDRGRIEAYLRRLSAEHQVLVCTGGLGPTTDDITTECAARVPASSCSETRIPTSTSGNAASATAARK